MTREEAIDFGKMWLEVQSDSKDTSTYKFFVMAIEALEQQSCEEGERMKDYNLINQRATTCRHGGHCEWVACDKCNHYEPDVLNQQPCEDAISRQAVINAIYQNCIYENEYNLTANHIKELVQQMPSVTPKEKTGKWIMHPNGIYAHLVCNKCLSGAPYDYKTNFCPNCGAKMEVEE